MKRLLFIINPCSGKGRIRNKLLSVLDIFAKRGYRVETYVTQEALDARRKAVTRGRSADLIVCSGGDGTLNEVVSGMMELKRLPVLGYIPAGSTNDYAASLGLPRRIENAARLAAEGKASPVDVGKFGDDRYFVYIAAFGAFTEVSYLTPQDKKNLLGHQAYMLEAVKRLVNLKSYRMRFETEDRELEGEFILGMVTNTLQVGGFKGLVGRGVALNDGEFEVLLVRTPKTPRDLHSIASYLFMREGDNECVYQFKAKHLKITSPESVDWTLDGEFGGSVAEVEIENLKQAFAVKKMC